MKGNKMKLNMSDGFSIGTVLLFSGIVLAVIVGWIWNIVKLFAGSWEITGEFVLRIIGVFVAPMGGVMGFL
jgi:hypothetical protein